LQGWSKNSCDGPAGGMSVNLRSSIQVWVPSRSIMSRSVMVRANGETIMDWTVGVPLADMIFGTSVLYSKKHPVVVKANTEDQLPAPQVLVGRMRQKCSISAANAVVTWNCVVPTLPAWTTWLN